jgi:sigma 54 modulation/S30EA-like ribosomal protein
LRQNVVLFREEAAFIDTKEAYPPARGGIASGNVLCDIDFRPAILSYSKMQIRVDVDDHIDGSEELMVRVEGVVQGSLDGYQEQVARVDVHLSQRIPHRHGERDMCCRMEAQAGGLSLISVTHEALTLTEAIHAASAKLERAVHLALRTARSAGAAENAEEDAVPGQAEGLGHLRSS